MIDSECLQTSSLLLCEHVGTRSTGRGGALVRPVPWHVRSYPRVGRYPLELIDQQ